MNRIINTLLIVATCLQVFADVASTKKAQDITVRFGTTRLSVVVGSGSCNFLQGKITASISTSLKFFKKPVLRVVALSEENGSLVVQSSIIYEPNMKPTKSYDDDITSDVGTLGGGIEKISKKQNEVSKEKFSNLSYFGTHGWNQGRYSIFGYAVFKKSVKAKLLGYRIEMWYDGECVKAYDTLRAADLKRLQMPDDWHVWSAHPEKFKYRAQRWIR